MAVMAKLARLAKWVLAIAVATWVMANMAIGLATTR